MIFFAIIGLIIIVLLTLKYPMMPLFFFLTTSLLKTSLMARFVIFTRYDMTVLAALFLLFGMMVALAKRPSYFIRIFNAPYLLMAVLILLLFLGVTYTSAPIYGWQKSSRFAVFASLMYLSPILFIAVKSDFNKILWILLIIGVLVAVVTIIMPHSAVVQERAEQRAGFLEAGPLETAEKIAIAGLVAFCFIVFQDSKKSLKIIGGIITPICLLGMVLTGARGSLFAMVLCCAVAPLILGRQVSKKWIIPGVLVVVLGMGYALTAAGGVAEMSVERISRLWSQEGGIKTVAETRLPLYSWTLSNIPDSPIFGHGTGSYAVDKEGVDQRTYPHNTILELLYENGLIGASVFVAFVYLAYRKWKQSRRCILDYLGDTQMYAFSSISVLLFIFAFLQAMKSNDIEGNRFMFFCAGLMMSVYYLVGDSLRQMEAGTYRIEPEFQCSVDYYENESPHVAE